MAGDMGFCFGVRRAVEMVEQAAAELGQMTSLGSIVHNQQVVERLRRHSRNNLAQRLQPFPYYRPERLFPVSRLELLFAVGEVDYLYPAGGAVELHRDFRCCFRKGIVHRV